MRPLLQQRQRNVQADERQHDQEAVRHRVIAVDHRLLDRFADNQEQDEIEGRQLAQRPPPDHAQEHHSKKRSRRQRERSNPSPILIIARRIGKAADRPSDYSQRPIV
jgi:hypothetical protein